VALIVVLAVVSGLAAIALATLFVRRVNNTRRIAHHEISSVDKDKNSAVNGTYDLVNENNLEMGLKNLPNNYDDHDPNGPTPTARGDGASAASLMDSCGENLFYTGPFASTNGIGAGTPLLPRAPSPAFAIAVEPSPSCIAFALIQPLIAASLPGPHPPHNNICTPYRFTSPANKYLHIPSHPASSTGTIPPYRLIIFTPLTASKILEHGKTHQLQW